MSESRRDRRIRRKRLGRYSFWASTMAVLVVLLTSPLVASAVVPYPAPRLADVSTFYDAHNVLIGSVN